MEKNINKNKTTPNFFFVSFRRILQKIDYDSYTGNYRGMGLRNPPCHGRV